MALQEGIPIPQHTFVNLSGEDQKEQDLKHFSVHFTENQIRPGLIHLAMTVAFG